MSEELIDRLIKNFAEKEHEFQIFMSGVSQWFASHPKLKCGSLPVIHSVKSRIKDRDHLREKIRRKLDEGFDISVDNFFEKVTDLVGVRVLHLYQEQFSHIHDEINRKVETNDWFLPESAKAYTWDPESQRFFEGLGIAVNLKESFYTSVHYLVKPRSDSPICCEIQVRTLFEEIWGEVDHALNYPERTNNLACREQLLVLAKVVGAGSRLVDSIFRISAASGDSHT